jgi:hypothetical protein
MSRGASSTSRQLQPLLKMHPWQKFLGGSMDQVAVGGYSPTRPTTGSVPGRVHVFSPYSFSIGFLDGFFSSEAHMYEL